MKKYQKSKKKRTFDQTRIGYLMKHITPLEYRLILEAGGAAPPIELIESLSYCSLDPFFKTTEFRKALIEYRRVGLRPYKPINGDIHKEMHYIRLRRKRMKQLSENIEKVNFF